MIFPLSGLVLGALLGVIRARIAGGRVLDLLQWGAVFAIMGFVIGLFVLIFVARAQA
jgi:hypothetical protein